MNLYSMDNNNKQNQNSNWQTITMLVIAALLTILIVGWMNSTVNARQRQELSKYISHLFDSHYTNKSTLASL